MLQLKLWALILTRPRELVNALKSGCGTKEMPEMKRLIRLVRLPILRPLMFKREISERFFQLFSI